MMVTDVEQYIRNAR